MSHVVAIANQKGGVGKTSTAINLGASLAAAERRTRIVDLDPQGNASSGPGVSARATAGSLYGTLLELRPLGSAVVRAVHLPQLDVVPTTPDLVGAEPERAELPRRELRLRRALDGPRAVYDHVLIDCPPHLGLLTLHDARLRLAAQVAAEGEGHFGPLVLRTRIPRNVRLAESPGFGRPALLYDAASAGARAYRALAAALPAPTGPRPPRSPRFRPPPIPRKARPRPGIRACRRRIIPNSGKSLRRVQLRVSAARTSSWGRA